MLREDPLIEILVMLEGLLHFGACGLADMKLERGGQVHLKVLETIHIWLCEVHLHLQAGECVSAGVRAGLILAVEVVVDVKGMCSASNRLRLVTLTICQILILLIRQDLRLQLRCGLAGSSGGICSDWVRHGHQVLLGVQRLMPFRTAVESVSPECAGPNKALNSDHDVESLCEVLHPHPHNTLICHAAACDFLHLPRPQLGLVRPGLVPLHFRVHCSQLDQLPTAALDHTWGHTSHLLDLG
mmetsp:Transcript_4762/g.8608  ORF Transcript_4762/g.8608 Transcript_4762/m.8608 type:complete len:242 (+) Transcript_4762:417-1142(+)